MSKSYTAREKVCPIHDPSIFRNGEFSGIGLQHGGHGLLARCAAHARAGTGHGAAWKEINEEKKQLNEGYDITYIIYIYIYLISPINGPRWWFQFFSFLLYLGK